MSAAKTLYIFPGQGSQYAGIGSDIVENSAAARGIYDRASETLGYDIAEMSFGNDERIHLTRYTQPVLLTHSIACLEAFREGAPSIKADATGGHSLGEYSALVAAGSLSFELGLSLVAKRGELMGDLGEGEMSALPLDLATVEPLAGEFNCGVAGCNLKDQTVVGGKPEDLERLETHITENFPRKRPVRLKTEGAFHTFYMEDAANAFKPVLAEASFESPEVDVLSNFTGAFHDDDLDGIRDRLYSQLFHPVLWHANLMSAAEAGVTRIVEFGGGIGKGETPAEKRANLEGIIKKAFRGAENVPEYHSVINADSLEKAISTL